MQQHIEANKLKDLLASKGFRFTISFYGIIQDKHTRHSEFRRIEVFLNKEPNEEDVWIINNFFYDIYPFQYYTVWAYNCDEKEIIMVDGWH